MSFAVQPRFPFPSSKDEVWQNDKDITDQARKMNIKLTNLGVVNVRDYGAKGIGGDDTSAINAALAATTGSCGYVYFPSGIYGKIGLSTVTCQTLLGTGKNATIVTRLSGTEPIFLLTASGTISGMTLDGNSLAASVLTTNGSQYGNLKSLLITNVTGSTYAFILNGSFYMDIEDLEFRNNTYGNMYIINSYYSSIYRTKMYAGNTDCGIKFGASGTDLNFYDTYMESCVDMTTIGLRDLRFLGMRVRLDVMNGAWWRATNTTGGGGSEVGQVSLEEATILKKVNISSYPVIDINSYQAFIKNFHVYDAVSSTGWVVIKDRGTNNLRLQDVTVESANPWFLFDSTATGGTFTTLDSVNYTQGVIGTCTLSSQVQPGGTGNSGFITVRNSNLNFNIATTTAKGGYVLDQIFGNIDLTNTKGPVWLTNSSGTVTDPNTTIIGSFIQATVLSSNTAATNVEYDITLLDLQPGKWDISGMVTFLKNTGVFTSLDLYMAISTTTGNAAGGETNGINAYEVKLGTQNLNFTLMTMSVPSYSVSLNSETTYYLKGYVNAFTSGQPLHTGRISATRR